MNFARQAASSNRENAARVTVWVSKRTGVRGYDICCKTSDREEQRAC